MLTTSPRRPQQEVSVCSPYSVEQMSDVKDYQESHKILVNHKIIRFNNATYVYMPMVNVLCESDSWVNIWLQAYLASGVFQI